MVLRPQLQPPSDFSCLLSLLCLPAGIESALNSSSGHPILGTLRNGFHRICQMASGAGSEGRCQAYGIQQAAVKGGEDGRIAMAAGQAKSTLTSKACQESVGLFLGIAFQTPTAMPSKRPTLSWQALEVSVLFTQRSKDFVCQPLSTTAL